MKSIYSSLVFAGAVSAQSLASVLGGNSDLSTLTSLVQGVPGLLDTLSGLKGITILAPTNEAFTTFTNANSAAIAADGGLVAATLTYHVLNGTIHAADILNATGPLFPHTLLTNATYEQVTGGQYVEALGANGGVTFYSGLDNNSTVTTADVAFDGGVVHVIDSVLTIPQNISATATADNLTSLASALTSTNLLGAVQNLTNITVFAPSNAAFDAISSVISSANTSTISSVLEYHVINGTVIFSTDLTDGAVVQTLGGASITIHKDGDNFFVNGALITAPDNLVENGVVHVIDEVLNPGNATAAPAPGATAGSVQFGSSNSSSSSGSSSGGYGNSTSSATPTSTSAASGSSASSSSGSGSSSGASSSSSAPATSTGAASAIQAMPVLGGMAAVAAFFL